MRLSYNVVFAASAFSIFYYMVIVFFAFAYQILGNTTGGHPDIGYGHGDGNDYERFNEFTAMFLYSYRTAIGDLETPNADLWKQIKLNDQSRSLIVYVLWLVWMIQ